MKAEPQMRPDGCRVQARNGDSAILSLPVGITRKADCVITPPNSSVMFAECAAIPVLTGELAPGQHWLCCAVRAGAHQDEWLSAAPVVLREDNTFIVRHPAAENRITITL
jgi:hypothetical protein